MKFDGLTLSAEQMACLDGYQQLEHGNTLLIEAGAGASKTTSLRAMAFIVSPHDKGLYIAYNNAIVAEVKRQFPATVDVFTSHGLAYQFVGKYFKNRLQKKLTLSMFIKEFKVSAPSNVEARLIAQKAIAAVELFCVSSESSLSSKHVQQVLNDPSMLDVVCFYAKRYWDALSSNRSQIPIFHDVYLKLFALGLLNGQINVHYDYALLDEAQDSVPVVRQIFRFINTRRKVAVGDSYQAIYQWRHAIDAMSQFNPDLTCTLSTSYRFGQTVADLANNLIAKYQYKNPNFTGYGNSSIVYDDGGFGNLEPDTLYLCRTNSSTFSVMMDCFENQLNPKIKNRSDGVVSLLTDLEALRNGHRVIDTALKDFNTFEELEENISAGLFSELKPLVHILKRYGYKEIIRFFEKVESYEEEPDLWLSTANSSKGLEADNVILHSDFDQVLKGNVQNEVTESNLLYVALTRVKKRLDITHCSTLSRIHAQTRLKSESKVNSKQAKYFEIFGESLA